MTRVLFVDDDALILEGLRDALRPHRHRWHMRFVTSGADALAALAEGPYDVIVSDLRMPGMDGATLLEIVRRDHCDTVRIVLSGDADMVMMARAAGAAHRMIAKPCATDALVAVVERSCALREVAGRMEAARRATGAGSLPSVPRRYLELTEILASGTAGSADVAAVVEADIAMSAKVLQLANSAYFGRRAPVSRIAEAVAYIGLDALRALVLQTDAFRQLSISRPIPGFDIELLQLHCTRVGKLAAALSADRAAAGDALTAGLLHDVGLLIFASHDADGLAETLGAARQSGCAVHEAERERVGVTHAEIGAHLLALWGLPPTVTEAVAGHHDRHELGGAALDPPAAVHVADLLISELEEGPRVPAGEELEQPQLRRSVARWRELAELHHAGG